MARCIGTFVQVISALLVLFSGSGLAHAHAVVIDSSPKDGEILICPPGRIVLHFDAKLEKSLSRFILTTGEGREIPLSAPAKDYGSGSSPDTLVIPLPALKPGNYILRYKVLSTDGHATPGILRFTVKGGT